MMTVMTGNGARRQEDSDRRWQCSSIQISAFLQRNKSVLRRNAMDPTSMALPVCLEMTLKVGYVKMHSVSGDGIGWIHQSKVA